MDKLVESANKEVLVEMVKMAQKRKMRGSKGEWKEFLTFYDKKLGTNVSDPARRNTESLVAFFKTFTEEDDLKFFEKALQRNSNREKVASLATSSPDDDSAEQRLVRMTLEHPQYPTDFFFPSYEEGWVVTKGSKKPDAKNSKKLISVDCEMVLCKDGTEAVIKVCAVDRNLEVILDEVINPHKEVEDYRTSITGMSAENFVGVTRSLKEVQKSLKRLISHGTILVGHGLHNDLSALKLEHDRVIDTSYIFKYANGPTMRKPSLRLLCKTMLNYDLRGYGDPHNSFDDACAAMKLVLARLEGKADGAIPEEEQFLEMEKLVIHRIPRNLRTEDLTRIIPGEFSIELKPNIKGKKTYTVNACYKSNQEAIEAFNNIEGVLEKDSCGRPQKLVKYELESGAFGTLCVCKTFNKGSDVSVTKKRACNSETDSISKKLKADETSEQRESTECETHLKEIERLKEELSKREEEILNLSKIITALARKQGL